MARKTDTSAKIHRRAEKWFVLSPSVIYSGTSRICANIRQEHILDANNTNRQYSTESRSYITTCAIAVSVALQDSGWTSGRKTHERHEEKGVLLVEFDKRSIHESKGLSRIRLDRAVWKSLASSTVIFGQWPAEVVVMSILGPLSKMSNGQEFLLLMTVRFFSHTRPVLTSKTTSRTIG